jgi:hypothetical protein
LLPLDGTTAAIFVFTLEMALVGIIYALGLTKEGTMKRDCD